MATPRPRRAQKRGAPSSSSESMERKTSKRSRVSDSDPLLEPHIIDDDGDLYLLVGPDKIEFRVHSVFLIRPCEYFKKMLTGPWAESRPPPGEKWTIALPEDDSTALEILLNIIHHRYDAVPTRERMEVDVLCSVCVLADYYGLEHLLMPWARDWVLYHGHKCHSNHLEYLWIALVLGHEEMFKHAVLGLTWHGKPTADGKSMSAYSTTFGTDLLCVDSIGVLDDIANYRKQVLQWIFGFVRNTHDDFLAEAGQDTYYCQYMAPPGKGVVRRFQCDLFMYGNLTHALMSYDLFPIPNAGTTKTSIKQTIDTIHKVIRKSNKIEPLSGHEQCKLRLWMLVDDMIEEELEIMVAESLAKYKPHLDRQGIKTGCDDPSCPPEPAWVHPWSKSSSEADEGEDGDDGAGS